MAGAVLELLHEVNRAGQTVVIVTHDSEIGGTARRLVRVQDGQIVADGTPAAVLNGRRRRTTPLRAQGRTAT
jgi:ABC-type lipoprotein export system ATPase subunit